MDASSLVLAVVKCPVQPVRIPSSLSFRWFLCLFYFLPLGDRFPRIIQRHSDSAPLPICFLFFSFSTDGLPRFFFSPIFASPRPTVLHFSIATFFFRFAASSSQPSLKRNHRIQTWFRLNFVGISFFCLHFFVVIQSNRLVRSRSTT